MMTNNISYLYEIEKSKFIAYIFQISNIDEVNNLLIKLKKEHKKAKHICYGYKLIENNQIKIKGFDDGEPKGTSSIPIINAIEKNNINNCVVFIVRYFGGIKLGKGGLYRSYSKSALEVIKLFLEIYKD